MEYHKFSALLSLSKRTVGTLDDTPIIGRTKTAKTATNIEQIKERHLHQERNPGQWSTAVKLGISLTTTNRAIKNDLNIKLFHKFKTSKMIDDHIESAKT